MYELETFYNTSGLYNLLEILDFKDEISELSKQELELKQKQLQKDKASKSNKGRR